MIRFKIFSENLAAIELRKQKALINKPFYVGFTVLELSKLLMYRFHYDYIKEKFGDKAELLFTDTDSLMYLIKDENMYQEFFKDRLKYFDFSEYPTNNPLFDCTNKKVVGFFKDEAKGQIITEFVGLRPKMYSYLVYNAKGTLDEKHRAKGIQREVIAKYTHADYVKELKEPIENSITTRRIGSKLHQIYSIETGKRGLCSFDDKRVLLDDEVNSLAYGHYKITGDIQDISEEAPKIITNQELEEQLDLTENDIPEGEDPKEFFNSYHLRRACLSALPEMIPKDEKRKVYFAETISTDLQRISSEIIKEKFNNITEKEKEYWKRSLYKYALMATKWAKTESEMKNYLIKIIDEMNNPPEETCEEFLEKFTAADFD